MDISNDFKPLSKILELYDLSRKTIENMFNNGKLKRYKLGKKVFVDENELKQLIASSITA